LPREAITVNLAFAAHSKVAECSNHEPIVKHFAVVVNTNSEEKVLLVILKGLGFAYDPVLDERRCYERCYHTPAPDSGTHSRLARHLMRGGNANI
jgi:hypothetical protein